MKKIFAKQSSASKLVLAGQAIPRKPAGDNRRAVSAVSKGRTGPIAVRRTQRNVRPDGVVDQNLVAGQPNQSCAQPYGQAAQQAAN